jgi:Putative prokaryotic signal transducing protein
MDRRGHEGGGLSGRFVLVYTTQSITDGHLVRGRLEADGIPVLVKGEGEGPYRMGPVHVLVPTELEVQARLILDDIRSGRLRLPDDEALPDTDWTGGEPETAPETDPFRES